MLPDYIQIFVKDLVKVTKPFIIVALVITLLSFANGWITPAMLVSQFLNWFGACLLFAFASEITESRVLTANKSVLRAWNSNEPKPSQWQFFTSARYAAIGSFLGMCLLKLSYSNWLVGWPYMLMFAAVQSYLLLHTEEKEATHNQQIRFIFAGLKPFIAWWFMPIMFTPGILLLGTIQSVGLQALLGTVACFTTYKFVEKAWLHSHGAYHFLTKGTSTKYFSEYFKLQVTDESLKPSPTNPRLQQFFVAPWQAKLVLSLSLLPAMVALPYVLVQIASISVLGGVSLGLIFHIGLFSRNRLLLKKEHLKGIQGSANKQRQKLQSTDASSWQNSIPHTLSGAGVANLAEESSSDQDLASPIGNGRRSRSPVTPGFNAVAVTTPGDSREKLPTESNTPPISPVFSAATTPL